MVLPGLSPDWELTEEKSGANSKPICKDLLTDIPFFLLMGVGMAFAVKARRAESETEPGRFVGTGPRTVDSDSWRAGDTVGVPDREARPDPLSGLAVEVLSGWSVDPWACDEADRPADILDEPGDEVVGRSCPFGRGRARVRPILEAEAPCGRLWLWVPGLPATEPEAPELLAAGLPVLGLPGAALAAGLLVGLPATDLPAVELPEADAEGAADAAGAADVGDPPEARS